MRIADTAAGEGSKGMQILDQGFFEVRHGPSVKRRMWPRKATTTHPIKINV
jgi:hypothetical protein